MRRDPRSGTTALLLALGLMGPAPGCGRQPGEQLVRFNILQLSDIYEIESADRGLSGGLMGVAALKECLVEQNKNSFAILSGDLLSPSPMSHIEYRGEEIAGRQMVDVMNLLGLDFATFGNHEFDLDHGQLRARLRESRANWVSTNTSEANRRPFEHVPRHLLVRVEDQASKASIVVALIGLTTNLNRLHDYVEYESPIDAASREIGELRGKYDVLIALTHQGLDDDIRLAKEFPEIDLILGGHDGRAYVSPEETGGVPIFKSDFNARAVWLHRCTFDASGKSKARSLKVEPTLTPIGDEGRGRNRMHRRIDKWHDRFARSLRDSIGIGPTQSVGHVPEGKDLDGREEVVRSRPTNLTRLIGESMIRALEKKLPNDPKLKDLPRLAIFNSGAVRLDDLLRPGPITAYDVVRILPFPKGEIRGVRMSRALAGKLLETRSDPKYQGKGWFLQVFGFDKDGRPSSDGGLPGDANEFLVAINNYLIDGNEQGFNLKVGEHKGDGWGIDLKGSRGQDDGWQEISGLHAVESQVKALIEWLRTSPGIDDPDEAAVKERAGRLVGLDEFDLELKSPQGGTSAIIRKERKNLVSAARVRGAAELCIFDGHGRTVVDSGQMKPADRERLAEALGGPLKGLWPPHELTGPEKAQVLSALIPIFGVAPVKPIVIEPATATARDKPAKTLEELAKGRESILHPPGAREDASLIAKLEETIEAETVERHRLSLAESLIHLEPESRLAANEIVEKFRGWDFEMRRDAERILIEATRSHPPALIRSLLPLLDLRQESQVDYESLRADVADLLSKVAPGVLDRARGIDAAGRVPAAVAPH